MMRDETQGSSRGWVGTVALVAVMLGTHVVLAQTTDFEWWVRSAIAITLGIVVAILATMVLGRRSRTDLPRS